MRADDGYGRPKWQRRRGWRGSGRNGRRSVGGGGGTGLLALVGRGGVLGGGRPGLAGGGARPGLAGGGGRAGLGGGAALGGGQGGHRAAGVPDQLQPGR